MDRLTFAATFDAEGDTLSGVVHVFGTRTLREGLSHSFDERAFDRSIKAGTVVGYYGHDVNMPLAKPSLEVRDGKLHYSMTLGHQSYAEDLRQNVASGLMTSMSFGVRPMKWKDAKAEDGSITRVHTASDLFDISPVAMPAFEGTKAMLHSAPEADIRREMARARYRVALTEVQR